nr:hypothetical protein [Gloiopeltis furcata]
MAFDLKFISNNIEGNWISQQTIYYLKIRQKSINTFKFDVSTSIKFLESTEIDIYEHRYTYNDNPDLDYNVNYWYGDTNEVRKKGGAVQKTYKKISKNYVFSIINEHTLKIKSNHENILYEEFVYYVNKNFNLSVITIKKLNNYVAICFTSSIKIIKQ